MKNRLKNQNLILHRQLAKFCKSRIFCSKLSPSQKREAAAQFMHSSETTNTRWMRSWTIKFKRQCSAVSIISILLSSMAIPVLALNCTVKQQQPRCLMGCTLNRHSQYVEGNRFSPWCLWSHCAQFYTPQKWSEIQKMEWALQRITDMSRAETLAQWGKAEGTGLVQAGREGRPNSSLPGPLGDYREDEARLFPELQVKETGDNKLRYRKLWLDGANNLTVKVVKQWKMLSGKNIWSLEWYSKLTGQGSE